MMQQLSLEELVHEKVVPNLDVLTSGPIPLTWRNAKLSGASLMG